MKLVKLRKLWKINTVEKKDNTFNKLLIPCFYFLVFSLKTIQPMIFSKIRNQHSFLQKAFLFLLTTGLIVLLFPRTGSFKYEFQKGAPWKGAPVQALFEGSFSL